jgi:hypothetical protein
MLVVLVRFALLIVVNNSLSLVAFSVLTVVLSVIALGLVSCAPVEFMLGFGSTSFFSVVVDALLFVTEDEVVVSMIVDVLMLAVEIKNIKDALIMILK